MATRGTTLVLDTSNIQIVAPLDTNENLLWSYVLPGKWMKESSQIWLTIIFKVNGFGGDNRLRGYFGSFLFLNNTQNTGSLSFYYRRSVANRGNLVTQISEDISYTNAASSGGTPSVGNVDTTIDTTISLTLQKATGTNACSLERVTLEFLP